MVSTRSPKPLKMKGSYNSIFTHIFGGIMLWEEEEESDEDEDFEVDEDNDEEEEDY